MAARPRGAPARWIAWAVVGVLVLVTAALAFLAIDRVSQDPTERTPDPVPSFSFEPESSATPTATPEPAAAAPVEVEERFLAIGAGEVRWRATAGECGVTEPLIERSADAGETWTDVTPRYRGIGDVRSLDAFADAQAEIVAAMGADCTLEALRTFTDGEFWQPYPEALAASRYLDGASVVTPDGALAAPCVAPRDLHARGAVVVLVCDGAASRLVGGEWETLPAEDVRAVAIAGSSVLTASEADGCSGVAVTRWSGDDLATAAELGCASTDPAQPLALAGTAETALVWSGDEVLAVAP